MIDINILDCLLGLFRVESQGAYQIGCGIIMCGIRKYGKLSAGHEISSPGESRLEGLVSDGYPCDLQMWRSVPRGHRSMQV
jgi:hypothetical protein